MTSVMIMAALLAHTGFAYVVATGADLSEGRIWDALYSVAYLCIAGALYWQYRLRAVPKKV